MTKDDKIRALRQKYRSVFNSSEGEAVLAHMKQVFGYDQPVFVPGVEQPFHAAIRDGQRQVIIHIESLIEPEPDKPKPEVKK